MRVQFTPEQCNGCGKCSRNCKAACIDSKNKEIDYSRCVSCFNCIESCPKGGMRYELRRRKAKAAPVEEQVDVDKRQAMATLGVLAVSSGLKAQTVKMDGGLAFIEDKKVIKRETIIVPAGGKGLRHFDRHCTGCQLCVTVCPNKALKPSSCLDRLMQPSLSYELGYCRPECVKCSEVCPTGAIVKIDQAEKSSTQIGHAVWVEQNCVVLTDGVSCGNCERHCPVGAITMIEREMEDYSTAKVPMIDVERCIGCGACEYLCPSRPFSAIYVEGHRMHRNI